MPFVLYSNIKGQLLNSAALLLQVQASLILQPTSSARQKQTGTRFHYSIQAFSLLSFIVAFITIEVNKGNHARFTSPHGVLGLITYILIVLQALGGLTQYFFPVWTLGSVARGKSMYKYHRALGYTLLILELGSIIAAMQTPFNVNYLHIPFWGVVVTSVLVVAGLGARIKKHKLGI